MASVTRMRSVLTAAVVALAVWGCRDRPAPPTPRLVGTGSPSGGVEPREDAVGIGGAGPEEPMAEEASLPQEPPSKPNELPANPPTQAR